MEQMTIVEPKKEKYEYNPWLQDLGGDLRHGKVVIRYQKPKSRIYKGESTQVYVRELVDGITDTSKFIKIFIDEENDVSALDLFIELPISAQKVLAFLLKRKIRYSESVIYFSVNDIARDTGLVRQTASLAVNRLIQEGWIAHSIDSSKYFINPTLFCIGKREDMFNKEYYKYHKTKLRTDE